MLMVTHTLTATPTTQIRLLPPTLSTRLLTRRKFRLRLICTDELHSH